MCGIAVRTDLGSALRAAHGAVDELLTAPLELSTDDELLDSWRELERLARRLPAVEHRLVNEWGRRRDAVDLRARDPADHRDAGVDLWQPDLVVEPEDERIIRYVERKGILAFEAHRLKHSRPHPGYPELADATARKAADAKRLHAAVLAEVRRLMGSGAFDQPADRRISDAASALLWHRSKVLSLGMPGHYGAAQSAQERDSLRDERRVARDAYEESRRSATVAVWAVAEIKNARQALRDHDEGRECRRKPWETSDEA